jgi:ribose transport system ATP-binding protein
MDDVADMAASGTQYALEASSVSKSFAGVAALRSLDLRVLPGEIHALVGENGSGKSSFIKILSGYHRPEPGGEVSIGGEPLSFGSPESAYRLGARFVQQDLGLVETSSVLDNLCLSTGFPTRLGTIRPGAARRSAAAALDKLGLDIDPRTPVSELSPAMKASVAIARALRDDRSAARLLVLDEPTATLPDEEVRQLLDRLRRAADSGVGVLYVTHRLDEVFEIADNLTVLRDGVRVAAEPVAALDRPALVHLLVGTELDEVKAGRAVPAAVTSSAPALEVTGFRFGALRDISFQARPGEIVGLAGITGSGRDALLGAVFGSTQRESGRVAVAGRGVTPGRPDLAIRAGVAYLPADRKVRGGIMDLTAAENLTLADLRPFWHRLVMNGRAESAETGQWFDRLSVRPAGRTDLRLGSFSGGNQQKILFGKWLRCQPEVLLLDEPTQGVDIAARSELHQQILLAAHSGTAVVVASSDVDELEALCTRVLVLRGGAITAELTGREISVERISKECLSVTRLPAA